MAAPAALAPHAEVAESPNREDLLTTFRDRLFGGSWGKLEFELRRLLQIPDEIVAPRNERIVEDLKTIEELRRKQAEFHVGRERRPGRRAVSL